MTFSRSFRCLIAVICVRASVILIAVAGFGIVPASAQTYNYSTIEVQGNQRIDSFSVIRFAGLLESGTVSVADLSAAYRRLSDAGLFEEIELLPEGNRIVISVLEYPIINRISIEGNRRLSDEQLLPLVSSQPRQVYNPAKAEFDAQSIAEAYRVAGRFAATVTPKFIQRSENRVDLVFEVFEGRVVEIERIGFVGNRTYSDSRLRRVLQSRQASIFRTIVQRDTFVSERIDLDRTLLRDFYLSRGFIDFQIVEVSTELTQERDAFYLIFKIQEGQQYTFDGFSAVTNIAGLDVGEFVQEIRIKNGTTYSPTYVNDAIERMEFLATEKGMQFLAVEPNLIRNDREQTLHVEFNLVRGPRQFVERIEIQGNTTTLDRVIRRQFRIVEGDPFNPREIAYAAERIRALGYFSDVEVTTSEGSSRDQAVVRAVVEERPTGSLTFGIGYALQDGYSGTVSLTERNLLGRGQYLSFSIASSSSTTYSLNFSEPSFLGRDVEFGLSTSYNLWNRSGQNFQSKELRFTPSFRFGVGELSRLQTRLGFNTYQVPDCGPGSVTSTGQLYFCPEAPYLYSGIIRRDLQRGAGDNLLVGYTYDVDTRRSGLDTNSAFKFEIGQDLTYGENSSNALRTTALAGAQTSIFNEDVTLSAELEGGAVIAEGGPSRTKDRFYMHSGVLRGFAANGIGPRDLGALGEPLGGNYYGALRLESQFPIGISDEFGISGGAFLDFGSLWGLDDTDGGYDHDNPVPVDDDLHWRSAVGLSLIWQTFFGPLRFNFSTDLMSEEYDQPQSFEMTISSRF